MRADSRLLPTLFTVSPDGLCFFDAPPINSDADAGEFASKGRLICATQAASVMVTAMEIWVAKTRPRAYPPLGMSPSSSLYNLGVQYRTYKDDPSVFSSNRLTCHPGYATMPGSRSKRVVAAFAFAPASEETRPSIQSSQF